MNQVRSVKFGFMMIQQNPVTHNLKSNWSSYWERVKAVAKLSKK
ncbi:hypothetical protein [uncultured Bacteroides sp.]|nr:hypothetical protein [uncultured Bacteroides sp.]